MSAETLEHVVGPLVEGVQECSRCGIILTDYRDCAVPAGSPPLQGLAPGQRFVKSTLPNGAGFGASRELTPQLAMLCDPILEHVAGAPEGARLDCKRCGVNLIHYTDTPSNRRTFPPEDMLVVSTATKVIPIVFWEWGQSRPCRKG